jgi:4-hydroxythreonine-4-phosphate dehydrogenase
MKPSPIAAARLPLALTMGEPAGIGGEIALQAWLKREGLPAFFVIDDAARLRRLAADLAMPVPVRRIAAGTEAAASFSEALPVLNRPLPHPTVPGRPDVRNAGSVIAAIEAAVACVRRGEAAAVVTNPINKKALYDAGFRFPGHTEFLAALAGGVDIRPVMMLVCPELRVVPVTVHMSLRRAIEALTTDAIAASAEIVARALASDFGVPRPRLAIAGINPHAGEEGEMGNEEATIIVPAVARLRASGIDAVGPLPPDTMFSPLARRTYDAAICMYHDQALIPLKALDFEGGVNVTLGLPFVRTSPDHGTAFDIAGGGRASASSLIAALRLASELAARRGGHGP